jgi:hypothetical protein
MINGGETIVKKVRDEEKGSLNMVQKGTENPLVKDMAKAAKANQKGKVNLHDLPWALGAPNPAATVENQDIKIENVGIVSGMKSRKRNLPTPMTPNTLLPSKLTRPQLCLPSMLYLPTPSTPTIKTTLIPTINHTPNTKGRMNTATPTRSTTTATIPTMTRIGREITMKTAITMPTTTNIKRIHTAQTGKTICLLPYSLSNHDQSNRAT